jgi:hypothetical protein
VLVVAIGVVIALIRVDGASETGPAAVPTDSTTTRSASTTTRPSPRPTSSVAPVPTAARQRGAVCDALVINADLGYPDSGARIIDCGAGWAVMASEISGDPFWVAYRGGRWQSVRDVSIYQSTCPDEAIARGAPAWMAIKHLGPCPTATPPSSTSRATSTTAASSTATPPTSTPPTSTPPTSTPPTSTTPTSSRAAAGSPAGLTGG